MKGELANKQMTDNEIDSLHVVRFKATPARLRMRREWGRQCGRRAWEAGIPYVENPLTPRPNMPMHDGWLRGWDEEHNRRVNLEPRVIHQGAAQ